MRLMIQYPQRMGPVTVPAGAAETITVDKWFTPPIAFISPVPSRFPAFIPVWMAPTVAETITMDKWFTSPTVFFLPLGIMQYPCFIAFNDVPLSMPPLRQLALMGVGS